MSKVTIKNKVGRGGRGKQQLQSMINEFQKLKALLVEEALTESGVSNPKSFSEWVEAKAADALMTLRELDKVTH